MAQSELEILISAGLLASMVIVALMVDLLKGKNEQLREEVVRLRALVAEANRREQLWFANQATPSDESEPESLLPVLAPILSSPASLPGASERTRVPELTGDVLVQEVPVAITKLKAADPVPGFAPRDTFGSFQQVFEASRARRKLSAEPISGIERELQKVLDGSSGEVVPPVESEHLPQRDQQHHETGTRALALAIHSQTVQDNLSQEAPSEQWEKRAHALRWRPAEEFATEPVRPVSRISTENVHQSAQACIPAGYYSGVEGGFLLSQLTQNHQALSGMIVSIGVTGEVTAQVHDLLRSLLGSEDFGCQSAADEFLLIYPHERGASAEHRLGQIAQQLSDFQSRDLRKTSTFFGYAGIEVENQPVELAMACANTRMLESKRGQASAGESNVVEDKVHVA